MINTFLLARDKFMPEVHLRQPGFTCGHCTHADHLLKIKKQLKKLKKLGFQNIFIKKNWTNLVFNMIWRMEILEIYLGEELLIKYYVKKHLILLKIQNMIDIKDV